MAKKPLKNRLKTAVNRVSAKTFDLFEITAYS